MIPEKPKKLVVFCKTFLPEFSPESIRTAAFIKYMLRDGWEIFLFTYSEGEITDIKYDFLKDISITRIAPVKIPVSAVNYSVNYIWQLIRTLKGISKIVKMHTIPFMFVSVPQLQPLIVGALTKMLFPSIRLIQEFRDTYSISELTSRSAAKSSLLQKLERFMMKYADDFIFVTPIIKDEYIKYFGIAIPKITTGHVILNGFDPEDYPERDIEVNETDKIRMSYTGNLYGSRNLDFFLEGLGLALKEFPSFKDKVEVIVAGDVSNENMSILNTIIAQYSLDNVVHFLGKQTHGECVHIQCTSTYNILVTHKTGSFYAIPSKIFEYAAAKRPVIAITADPLTVSIIHDYHLGECFPHNVCEIAKGFNSIFNRGHQQVSTISIPDEFRRDYQIHRIAEVISGES